MILRYISPNNVPISGTVSVVPDTANTLDAEQKFQVSQLHIGARPTITEHLIRHFRSC